MDAFSFINITSMSSGNWFPASGLVASPLPLKMFLFGESSICSEVYVSAMKLLQPTFSKNTDGVLILYGPITFLYK